MPRRKDIRKIMLIGSGPIVIGQACEFDYSGVQACKALRPGIFSMKSSAGNAPMRFFRLSAGRPHSILQCVFTNPAF